MTVSYDKEILFFKYFISLKFFESALPPFKLLQCSSLIIAKGTSHHKV